MTCLASSTCVAARPMPGAVYMVSNISSTSFLTESSTVSTVFARLRSRGSGKWSMFSIAIRILAQTMPNLIVNNTGSRI